MVGSHTRHGKQAVKLQTLPFENNAFNVLAPKAVIGNELFKVMHSEHNHGCSKWLEIDVKKGTGLEKKRIHQ